MDLDNGSYFLERELGNSVVSTLANYNNLFGYCMK